MSLRLNATQGPSKKLQKQDPRKRVPSNLSGPRARFRNINTNTKLHIPPKGKIHNAVSSNKRLSGR